MIWIIVNETKYPVDHGSFWSYVLNLISKRVMFTKLDIYILIMLAAEYMIFYAKQYMNFIAFTTN